MAVYILGVYPSITQITDSSHLFDLKGEKMVL